MTNKIDKTLYLDLLSKINNSYPSEILGNDLLTVTEDNDLSLKEIAHIKYLEDHKLIKVKWLAFRGQEFPNSVSITSTGLDYLAEDGGLTSELGVVTIKLHADTIRNLMIAKIEASDGDPTVKRNLIKKIKELPADALETATMGLLEKGISTIPNLIQWFSSCNFF